ncbi:hypothetical protein TNCV_2094161 [Trichonephila clavipes]|nr:hypothetical protein TNCV_2094161 [Trichonephila clavipes]
MRNQYPEQPPVAVITELINLGIKSNRNWMTCIGRDTHVASTRCYSSSTIVTGVWFVVGHTIQEAPVWDEELSVATAMVSELRVHAAAYVVELFV